MLPKCQNEDSNSLIKYDFFLIVTNSVFPNGWYLFDIFKILIQWSDIKLRQYPATGNSRILNAEFSTTCRHSHP